ncbi:MAG: hypothetical protein PWP65_957 [Clostridia bacterium]|nr:hypothetical protein [Clostridia bacterium]
MMGMYLIPRNVITRFQFFPGFGWFELGAVTGAALIGLIFYALAGLFTPSALRLGLILLPAAAAYFVTRPSVDGQSLYGLVMRWRKWAAAQRRYLYAAGRD